MDVLDIEKNRLEKINSLFSDQVESEKAKFKSMLSKTKFSIQDKESILATLDFACQIDYGTGPLCSFYVTHPIRVACLAVMWQVDEDYKHSDMIKAALIHNCLEKDFLSLVQLEENFGSWISETISVLTVDREKQYQGDWLVKYYKKIDELGVEAQMLKVLDKFDNLYALCLNPDDNIRKMYLEEIETYISPRIKQFYFSEYEYFTALYTNTLLLGYKSKLEFGF